MKLFIAILSVFFCFCFNSNSEENNKININGDEFILETVEKNDAYSIHKIKYIDIKIEDKDIKKNFYSERYIIHAKDSLKTEITAWGNGIEIKDDQIKMSWGCMYFSNTLHIGNNIVYNLKTASYSIHDGYESKNLTGNSYFKNNPNDINSIIIKK